MTDIDVLLILMILVGLFSAYEEAAIRGVKLFGHRLHTISWYASWHPRLQAFISDLFLIGGIVGYIWFHFIHALPGHIAS